MHRRRFLQYSAASLAAASSFRARAQDAASAYALPDRFPEDLRGVAPRVALIGSGWYGKVDLTRMIQVAPVEVVGLCDVDERMLDRAAGAIASRQLNGQRPETFADYAECLEQTRPDVVIVNTPDHWHALPTVAAIEAGCDVYLQKPTSVDVAEGEAMLAAAREHARVVQIGTQRRSTAHLIEARDRFVNDEMLGDIAHVETCCYYRMRTGKTAAEVERDPPEFLDWDAWTGPAPMRPFNTVAHPSGWRSFREYGNGFLGDMGVHMIDAARWMLGLGWPTTITGTGGVLVDPASVANVPDTQSVSFQYPGLMIDWSLRTWGDPPDPDWPWACTIFGSNGTLRFDIRKYEYRPRGAPDDDDRIVRGTHLDETDTFPEDRTERRLEVHTAPATRAHITDFLRCVRDRTTPVATLSEGHTSTAMCILGNAATATGETVRLDGGTVTNPEPFAPFIQRDYRGPWRHPASTR